MAGKHMQKKSNVPLVILIIVAVIVIAAVVAGVIFFMNGGMSIFKNAEETPPATAATTIAAVPATQGSQTETKADETTQPVTAQAETGVPAEEGKIDVVVPMDEGVEPSYFDASFIPNGKVDDTMTGQSVTLREVFGQSAADGVLTFNSDGTFRDTLVSGEHNRGAYVVQKDVIHATYTNDKNMIIEVAEWDGGTPVRFTVLYGDFLVYFG